MQAITFKIILMFVTATDSVAPSQMPSMPASQPSTTQQQPYPQSHANKQAQIILSEALRLVDALQYDQVIPLMDEILYLTNLTLEEKLQAYFLKGSALAIIGEPVKAERAFRFLLRASPKYELPNDISPKVSAVFRKVQVEEEATRHQLEKLERKKVVAEMQLQGSPPRDLVGGRPIFFQYALRDPRRAVQTFRLEYRKAGEKDFSSLALKPDDQGNWSCTIPAELTQNKDGMRIDYFLTTKDSLDENLLTIGNALNPQFLEIAPGTIESAMPLHKKTWFWILSSSVALGVIGGTGWYAYQQSIALPETDGKINIDK
ncbi:MAG: hypothetical protein QGI45_08435 [Myxococcota bacterium]|nr:hypothetical protein [Myxococcota bacterium]